MMRRWLLVPLLLLGAAGAAAQTPTPTPYVEVNLDTGSGAPGALVAITAELLTHGQDVAAAGNDITYDNTALSLELADCTSAIGDKLLTGGVVDIDGTETTFRVFIVGAPLNTDPIPDGNLYTCIFAILPGAASGTYPLTNTNEVAQDPNGVTLSPVIGADGEIVVNTPVPSSTPTATRTATGTVTATGTPTVTATRTATRTAPPTPTLVLIYNRDGRVLSVPNPLPTGYAAAVVDTKHVGLIPFPTPGGGGGSLSASGATSERTACLDEEVATASGQASVSTSAQLPARAIVTRCLSRTNVAVSGGYWLGLAGAEDLWGATAGTLGATNLADGTMPGPFTALAAESVVATSTHSSGQFQDNSGRIRVVCFCDEIGAPTE